MEWIDNPPEYRGLRAVVMGLGRFGGGEAAVRFLANRGCRVVATDLKSDVQLSDVVARLSDLPGVEFQLGEHVESEFLSADLIVVNPAVSLDNRLLQRAADRGVRLTSEINLFWMHCPAPVIGVTGTNGKSTTASLIHTLLRASGLKTRLAGNIGRSLLGELDEIDPEDRIILELSSFQLEGLDRIGRSPSIAVVTNFSPNHLERHGTVAEYRRAKQTVLRFQTTGDVAILNADDDDSGRWPTNARRLSFGGSGRPDARFDADGVSLRVDGRAVRLDGGSPSLRGAHNRANLAAAALAAAAAGADLATAETALDGFQGLPHRMQYIVEREGRVFIDDSKSTTPESTMVAIDALRRGPGRLILLAGGADKQVDLRPLARRIADSVSAVALMGATARALAALLDEIGGARRPPWHCARSFEDAFDWAVRQTRPGDTVLLSPGCASYGWFENFEERGLRFAELARRWSSRT